MAGTVDLEQSYFDIGHRTDCFHPRRPDPFRSRPPFPPTSDPRALFRKILWAETEPVEGVGAQLARLIERLEAFEPGQRPGAGEAAECLRRIRERPQSTSFKSSNLFGVCYARLYHFVPSEIKVLRLVHKLKQLFYQFGSLADENLLLSHKTTQEYHGVD